LRPVLVIGIFSIISSLLTLEFVVNTEWYDVKKFNLVVIALLVYMLVFTLLQAKKEAAFSLEQIKLWQYALIGLCSGIVASVSGLGGGIIIIPLLNTLMKVDIKKAGSISSGVIMLTSMMMTFFSMTEKTKVPFDYYSMGYIIFPIGIALSAGVLVSSPFGVRKAAQLSPKIISYIYAAILTIVIIKKVVELIFVYQ